MKRNIVLVVCIVLLCSGSAFAIQPALPTSFVGVAVYEDGTPAQGVSVTAVWKDTDDVSQVRTVKTLTNEDAEVLGEGYSPGQFFFNEGYVLAAPASKIILSVEGTKSRQEFLARPGDKLFELTSNLVVVREEESTDLSITDITTQIFDTLAFVEWKTTTFANSQMSYTTLSGSHNSESELQKMDHSAVMWGLVPSKAYTYNIEANDGRGHRAKAPLQTLTTKSVGQGSHFLIHGVEYTTSGDSILVEWDTQESCEGAVAYGQTKPPSLLVREKRQERSHFVRLEGLSFSTTYHFAVICRNGNLVEVTKDGDQYFSATMRATDSQPALPTVVFGKVTYEDELYGGIPIEAMWIGEDGEEKIVSTHSITLAEAVALGDQTLLGSFYFRDVQINAPKGTTITIRGKGVDSSLIEVTSDPGQYVGVDTELKVFDIPEEMIVKKTMGERVENVFGEIPRTHLILISVIAFFSIMYLLTGLVRHMRMSKMKRYLMRHVDKMVSNQFVVESIEAERERETVRNYLRAKVGLILLEMLQRTERGDSIRVSSEEEQKMVLVRKGEHRAFTMVDSGFERMLVLDVVDIYAGTVVLRINHISIDLMMQENVAETIQFEVGRVRSLVMTPVSVRVQEEGNSAYLLFQFRYN